jgi:hypothetical protein
MLFPFKSIEPLDPSQPTPSIIAITEKICEAGAKIGRPWSNVDRYKQYFEEVGFENVVERRFYWPVGFWAKGDYYKSLAAYMIEDIRKGIEPISKKLLPIVGMSSEEIETLVAEVKKDLENPKAHAYLEV